jgi:phospholipid transport system substrate-binding protein
MRCRVERSLRRIPLARALRCACAASLLLVLPMAAPADPARADAVVERLHAALLDVMRRADELGYAGRRDVLGPVLAASFDFPFMSRLALGSEWRKLDEAQRKRWVSTFQELSLATYASRFDSFSGESFAIDATEPAGRDTMLVKTRLVRTGDEPVHLNYRLRQDGGSWRIIDVYLNGTVSEVALRRSEYGAVLDRSGFEALLAELETKIGSYASGALPASSG